MREMWELPGPSARARALQAVQIVGLVWALVAVPLTIWLVLRTPPAPPPPATRHLSVMENAAVSISARSLANSQVSLSSTVDSAAARLEVKETVDVVRGIAHGTVQSQSQSAELLTLGDRVLLRGSAAFWATIGVPTNDPDWIEVGDRLGAISFPIAQALKALAPGPDAVVDYPAADASEMTFHAGNLAADFTASGLTQLTMGSRSAKVARPSASDVTALNAAPVDHVGDVAKLVGNSGALTVAPLPAPPPPAPGA